MYKRGSSGYANAGTEPYCEIIGSSVAEKLCRNSVHYDLVTLHGEIATRCRLFTSEKYGYAPFSVFMKGHTLSISEAVSFFERLGQESADTFRRMMVIDALTFNRDRHAGNFGVLFDNDTLEPVKMAPVFDMNMCMLAGFMAQNLENPWSRIRQFSPSFSGVNDFISLGKAFLNSEIRKDLISTGKLTVGIKPDKVMANDMIRRLEKILNLQKDALLSGKYSDESEVGKLRERDAEHKTAEERYGRSYQALPKEQDADIIFVHVSPTAILLTVGVFAVIFLLLFINSVRQIMGASAVTLIRSENLGEKPPKANPLLGIIGAVLLIGAYITAVVITEPLSAILVFFIAVIMVIIGTYLLMIFGSVLLCRFLQKRKNYYYKPNHFISVSSMTYRMKRNGAGLASVCVLATMVLVMISSTTCLLFGAEDSVNTRYPRDIVLSTGFDTIDGLDDGNIEKVAAGVDSLAASHKANASNFASYRSVVTVGTISDGGKLIAGGTGVTIGSNSNAYICFDVVPIEDYNAVMGTNETLAPDEVIVYGYRMKYKYDTVTLGDGKTYKVKKTADSFLVDGDSAVNADPHTLRFLSFSSSIFRLSLLC